MDYNQAITTLTSQGRFYIDLGLDRIKSVLELLGNPQDKVSAIQVAGTNGKGSTCAMIENILRTAGYKTGLYTSPHIFDYTERINICGNDISKEEFSSYFEEVITVANKNEIHLTEFEILTAMMFKYFADNKVEIAVIETGLGGRLDATNVLKTNICSVITHIDYDHTERLGETKDKIASEKAGIIKPDSVVVTSEGYEAIKDKADEMNSMFVLVNPYVMPEYIEALSLRGTHQVENLALVLSVLELRFSDISKKTIIKSLKTVKNPCRFEFFSDKNMIIDVAHNPDCMQRLVESLDKYYPDIDHQYIFGCLKTKDYKSMIKTILEDERLKTIYFFEFENENSLDYATFSSIAKAINPSITIKQSSFDKFGFSDDVLTVVCGSFYMLKELVEGF